MAGVSKSIFNIISGEKPTPRASTEDGSLPSMVVKSTSTTAPHFTSSCLQYTLLEKSGKRTLGLNSVIGRQSGQDVCPGPGSTEQSNASAASHPSPSPALSGCWHPSGQGESQAVSRQGASALGLGRNHAPKVHYQQTLQGLEKGHRGRSEGGSRRLWVML